MEFIHNVLFEPWPWYIGGPMIGLFVIGLLLIEKKQLGISSSLQYACSKLLPINWAYFKNTEKVKWQLFFVIGLVGGGIVCSFLPSYDVSIADSTKRQLSELGFGFNQGFYPTELFSFSFRNVTWLFLGGTMIGFGARYANGCTAGHAIMGVSQLSMASIISTACFFVGGLLATHIILPLIF